MKYRKIFSALVFAVLGFPALMFAGGYFTFTSAETIEPGAVSVEIDGQPVNIVDFFHVDAADNSGFLTNPAGRRQIVILFDLIFSSQQDLLSARKITLDLIQKAGKDDLISIAGISIRGLVIYCAPTTDRSQIIAGLNAIGLDKVAGMTAGPEGNFYSAKFSSEDQGAPEPLNDQAFVQNLKPFGLGEKRKQDHAFILVQGLVDFAHALCGLQGRKTLLFFSAGFETKGISLNLDLEQRRGESKTAIAQNDSEPASLDTITNSFRNIEDVAKQGPSVRHSRETGVEIIPELYDGTDSHLFVVNSSQQENGFLKSLAEKTGGTYFQQQPPNVSEILAGEQQFYVVHWEDAKRKDWKALSSVKVSAGSQKITAPAKWLVPRHPSEQSPEEKRLHVAETVYKDFQETPADCRFWSDLVYDDTNSKVPAFVQLPGSFLQKYGQSVLKMEFYAYLLGLDGEIVDSASTQVELDLSKKELRDRITSSGLKMWNVLIGKPKPMAVRFVIINPDTEEAFTNTMFLDVKDAGLAMSNPFIPATDFNWVLWPKPQETFNRRGVELQYPYHMGANYFFPDLSPVLKASSKSGVVYFRLYNVLPESKNPAVKFQLTDEKGKSVEIQDFHLLQKPNTVEHSGMELFWALATLPQVQPGSYRIKIGILDPIRKQFVIREIRNLKIPSS